MRLEDAALPAEAEALAALNNAAVPAVNGLSPAEILALAAKGTMRVVREDGPDGALLGLLLTMDGRQDYDSLNYRWFQARYSDFLYVDRVIVADAAKGRGVGRLLYEDAIARAAAAGLPHVLAEVNVDPPNPASHAFHARLGFRPLAERLNEREGKVVAMLERAV